MWVIDGVPDNPVLPYFAEVRRRAANIGDGDGDKGTYTLEMFQTDFPEFYTKMVDGDTATFTPMLPEAVLSRFVESANNSIIPSKWGDDWRLAAGLYVAHMAALRLQTYSDGSTPANVSARSANVGTVKQATMGDTSLSYDNAAINSGTEKWGAWNLTRYGNQLATMARMVGIAGVYVI